jgi:intein/homing endonuclease
LDNFHKLPDYGEINGHERVKRLSNHLKNMTIMHRATIVSTVEYRKMQAGEEPSNVAMAECLVEDSIIINAQTGERVKIKDIEPGTLVNTIEDETFKIVPKKIKNKVFKGVQNCFEVVLENGFSIRGTENHPLLKDNGQWTQIKNLKIGDCLGVPSKQPILSEDKEYYSSEIARFLGYMAGDGNYGTGKDSKNQVSTPRFTNSEKKIYEDICSIVENNFPEIRINQNDHLGSKEIKFSRNSGKIDNKVKTFLQEENLWGELGEKKTIPAKIFKSNNIIKANYLAGLYLSDGSVSSEKTSIRFFNTSKDLIYGARELLLQLGISSSISMIKEENPKHKDGYTLRVNNHDIEKFKSIVPFIGNKNNRLKEIDISNAISHTGSRDNLSLYFAEEIHKHHKNTDGLSVWLSHGQKKYAHQLVPHSKINRATFEKYKESFSVPKELEKFISEDIIWLQIKSINFIGEYPTYDLEVEDTHNFIADGIFCHNSRSLQYDANIILHLTNDLHLSGENNATLLHYDAAGKALPRIRVKFGKNKVSGYEGREFLNLYPANAQLRSVDTEQAIQELKERVEYLKLNKPPKY